jgi:hypothetical protein
MAVNKLKCNKKAGNKGLSSDLDKNASSSLFVHIAFILTWYRPGSL